MRVSVLKVCLVASCFAIAAATTAAAPRRHKAKKSVKELKAQLHTVRAKIHQRRVALHQTRVQALRTVSDIHWVEGRIGHTEQHLHNVKARLNYLARQDKALQSRIVITRRGLDNKRRLLVSRLRQNYEMGDTTYLQVLLQSRTVHDYVSRSYYVERIAAKDAELVAGIRADSKRLEDDEHTLLSQAREQQSLQRSLEDDRTEYKVAVQQKRILLSQQMAREHVQAEELQEMEEASNDITSEIQASMATPAGHARLMQPWSGHFIRPAFGPITSGFGGRFHPILHRFKMHTGIDIGAGYGAPIQAADSGEVIKSGTMRGYGNVVVIDHGGGISTLYGHCSALLVHSGQVVHRGQLIARVGATGLATGPHLHWEVRRNGCPTNPLSMR